MRPRVVLIEVLVNVQQKVVRRPVWICDVHERRGTSGRYQSRRAVEIRAREEDHLASRTGTPDTRHHLLAGGSPDVDIQIVWLVHKLEDHAVLVRVLGRQLRPQRDELVVSRTSLPYNAAVPSRKVVYVDHAVRSGTEASLHKLVVLPGVVGIEVAAELVVDQELPRDGQPEHVKRLVQGGPMLHLPWSIATSAIAAEGQLRRASRTCAVYLATEVTACDSDSEKLHLCGRGSHQGHSEKKCI